MTNLNNTIQSFDFKLNIPVGILPYKGVRDLTADIFGNYMFFSPKWVHRFECIVDELINNAAEHGSSEEDFVTLELILKRDHSVEIIVEDHGTGPDPADPEKIYAFIADRQEQFRFNPLSNDSVRGRGLALMVEKWVDTMKIEKNSFGGLTFHIYKHLADEDVLLQVKAARD